jgi:Cu-processing system permease protein
VRNIWILARMTFLEASRRRIVLAGLVLGLGFLVIYSIGFHFIISQIRVVAESAPPDQAQQSMRRVASAEGANTLLLAGLYAVTFLSIAMAALLAADTLAGEISSGTIQTIVTKPIRRLDVVLGKWLGFALLLGLYLLLMAGGTVLSVLIQVGYTPHNLAAGMGLIYFEALLIMTISMACSSAFSALATGGIVFGLYGLAFIGGWIEQFGAIVENATAAYEMQSPLAGALGVSPFSAVSVPSLLMIAYTGLYLLGALSIAVRIFDRRDI